MKPLQSVVIWLLACALVGCAGEFLNSEKDESKSASGESGSSLDPGNTSTQNTPSADAPRRPLEEAEDLGYLTYPTNSEIEFKVAGTTFIIPAGGIVGTDWVSIAIGGSPDKLKVEFFWPMTREHLETVNFAGEIVMVYVVEQAMTSPVARVTPSTLPPQAAFELPGTYNPETNTVTVSVPQQKIQPAMEVELHDNG